MKYYLAVSFFSASKGPAHEPRPTSSIPTIKFIYATQGLLNSILDNTIIVYCIFIDISLCLKNPGFQGGSNLEIIGAPIKFNLCCFAHIFSSLVLFSSLDSVVYPENFITTALYFSIFSITTLSLFGIGKDSCEYFDGIVKEIE